jgi:hypothetical protein
MEPNVSEEIQRALGRIEGQNAQILDQLAALKGDFTDHKGEDRNNFQAVASRFGSVYKKLEEADVKRDAAFSSVEGKLLTINSYVDNIKGAWWLVCILSAAATGLYGFTSWVLGIWPFRR